LPIRNRHALGGAAGIALLALAFGWRWLGAPVGRPSAGGESQTAAQALAAPLSAPLTAPLAAMPGPAAVEAPSAPAESVPPADEGEESAPGAGLAPEAAAALEAAVRAAVAAAEAGRLIAPPEDSALFWYQRALEIDPRDRGARDGLHAVVTRAVEVGHAMVDRGELGEADALLALLASVPVGRKAIDGLRARREAQPRVAELLRQGAQRLAAGQRFEPQGESALDSYRAALSLDERNVVARQGLAEIESAVLERALAAASEDRFEDADRLLGLAATVLPGTPSQLATRVRVLELKRRRVDGLIEAAGAALDARNAGAAEGLIARALALLPDDPRIAALQGRLADARTYDNQRPGDVIVDPFMDREGSAPELVVIPVGEFDMGSPEGERGRRDHEGPQHRVRIGKAFALARTETTVADFRRFVRASGYVTDAERSGNSSVYDEKSGRIVTRAGVDWRRDYLGEEARADHPVLHVSFNDAQAYVAWLSERTGRAYRLPSEAEFEYALRAGTTTRFWWGNGNPLRVVGNFTGDGDRSRTGRAWTRAFPRYSDGHFGPAPVASFPANGFGVFDMNGNVSEWVEDCWHDSYLRAPDDGSAWVNRGCARRVVRGGSWGSATEQFRSAYRTPSPPDVRSARIGFRVARDL
jgi:formylglycine-generating enzyme required for sulfatase activity